MQQAPDEAGEDDISPIEVLRSAVAFLDAADREHRWLQDRGSKWSLADAMPIYFLYGQGIELALKAYLRATGFTSRQLAKPPYMHDLLALYRECGNKLLVIGSHPMSMLGIITKHYNDIDWHIRFRYVSPLTTEFPTFDAVSIFSRVLIEGVQPVCEGIGPLEAALLTAQKEQPREESPFGF